LCAGVPILSGAVASQALGVNREKFYFLADGAIARLALVYEYLLQRMDSSPQPGEEARIVTAPKTSCLSVFELTVEKSR
jgi:hypothetical protein